MRAFFADPRHPFDVVDRVAHQREHVDDLFGRDAELVLHARRVVPRAFFLRVEHADPVVDELKKILVAGDDRHVEAGGGRLRRQRPDHIVGLVALGRQDRHAQRFARGVHHRNLEGELVGHRPAVRLVVGREIVAERAPRQVERRRDVLGFVFVQQLPQHRHENVDGVGWLSLGVAEKPAVHRAHRRVIRAVHLRAAVDEIEEWVGRHEAGEIFTISLAVMRFRGRKTAREQVAKQLSPRCASSRLCFFAALARAAAEVSSGNTNTRKRCTSRSTGPRRCTSTVRWPR